MRLAIVTDEISQDPATAVELGREWGIEWFELRMVMGGRVPDVDGGTVARIEHLLEKFGGRVSALSPGFFKMPVIDEDVRPLLADAFPRALDLTCRLGADRMIVFGFLRPRGEDPTKDPPSAVVELLEEMAERAAGCGVVCVLENEHVCYGDTGLRAAGLIRAVGHDNLKLNWDPGNSVSAGCERPFPDEYEQIRDLVAHVHVKDVVRRDGRLETVAAGEGMIDWVGQLRALQEDGYEGFLTIETHFEPKVAGSRRSLRWVRKTLECF